MYIVIYLPLPARRPFHSNIGKARNERKSKKRLRKQGTHKNKIIYIGILDLPTNRI